MPSEVAAAPYMSCHPNRVMTMTFPPVCQLTVLPRFRFSSELPSKLSVHLSVQLLSFPYLRKTPTSLNSTFRWQLFLFSLTRC